jgi:hypothetical protein
MILINFGEFRLSYNLTNIIQQENTMGCCGGCGGEGHEPVKTETKEQQEHDKKQDKKPEE